MFIAIGHRAPERPECFGPFECFADASAKVAEHDSRLVVEFSCVYGWLAIWEWFEDRFELLRESAASVVLQSGRGESASRGGKSGEAASTS